MQKARQVFEKQWIHLLSLSVLVTGMVFLSQQDRVGVGQLWGANTLTWYWVAVSLAIIHQVYVWFCWRMELHAKWLTKALGGDRGFRLYSVGFAVIGLARMITVFLLAISNQGTLMLGPVFSKICAIILLIPALYLFYSVKQFFSFQRAFGIDHFDESYCTKPFERRGIFRYTRNGMYIFGFLILWVPAFWWASAAALIIALFNHIYIWVHYFTTELPDMKHIYGDSRFNNSSQARLVNVLW